MSAPAPVAVVPRPVRRQPVALPIVKAAPAAAAAAPAIATPIPAKAASPTAGKAAPPSPSSAELLAASLLLDLPGTRAYKLVDGHKQLVSACTLEVLVSGSGEGGEDVYLVVVGRVQLALHRSVPCLEIAPRNFVFPTDKYTYGILIADEIADSVLEVFRLLLTDVTSFRVAAESHPILSLPDRPDRFVSVSGEVASGLATGSAAVAVGVIRGGQMVGKALTKGGVYLVKHVQANATATEVSPRTKQRLASAKMVSGAACQVSSALVLGALATTAAMAKQLTAAIKETDVGKKLVTDPSNPQPRIEAAKQVGHSAVGAMINVYAAIETALFGVARDAAAATVTVVTHKYGADAGHHTAEGLGVVGNVAVAAKSVKSIGLKAIARKTAIQTTHSVLAPNEEEQTATSSAPSSDALAAVASTIVPIAQLAASSPAARQLIATHVQQQLQAPTASSSSSSSSTAAAPTR